MRRSLLLSPLLLFTSAPSQATQLCKDRQRIVDSRLLGTWKTDEGRPSAAGPMPPPRSEEEVDALGDLLAPMFWKITPSGWQMIFGNMDSTGQYNVIAQDENSVVIEHVSRESLKPALRQYFFEENFIYVFAQYSPVFLKRIEA